VITAWFASSNGGQTKRSDQAWSASTPWTISQADPWDAAGREKWNVKAIMHCVGMSQTGAAYAASIGVTYDRILAFYYPNTELVKNFGQGNAGKGKDTVKKDADAAKDSQNVNPPVPEKNAPAPNPSDQKSNTGLVEFARAWLGQPYWYGTCCYPCTSSLLKSKTAQYPSMYTAARMARYQKDIKEGKSCADCVGLIKGYHWFKDGKVKYDKKTDVSATGLLNLAKIKGPIRTMPEIPGLVLHKQGHVGIYEGNGNVIEAKGFAHGIIRSKIGDTPWTSWMVDPLISYAGYEDQFFQNTPTPPYTALVVTKTSPLNIWNNVSKAVSLLQVKKGDTLTVTGNAGKIGWFTVEKNGVSGVADGQYLQSE
jgi:cell wall-associated NlpC family hydrolase